MQNFTFNLPPNLAWVAPLVGMIIGIAFVVMHILFMAGIWNDCKRLENSGRPPAVLSPLAWALAGLLTGLMGVGLYWVVHYSRFARKSEAVAK